MIQKEFSWERSQEYSDYNKILAYYQAMSCIENSKNFGSVLDVACGDGTLTAIFRRHFKHIVGIDASSSHIAKAVKLLCYMQCDIECDTKCDVEFHKCLIEEFECEEKFDSVFMCNILEHVIDPIFVLKKSANFLKDDGIMIVHVPNALAINRRIAVLMGTLESCEELSPYDINIAGHRRSYTLESLKEDINIAGLRVIKTGGIFYKMLSTPQMDWFLKNGLWNSEEFGWGRVGTSSKEKDWKSEFCKACYEIGKERPEDCNIIYACIEKV